MTRAEKIELALLVTGWTIFLVIVLAVDTWWMTAICVAVFVTAAYLAGRRVRRARARRESKLPKNPPGTSTHGW
jgi:membrane protein implicated in regulation of membrane protease activity